jgi:ABC-type multidrug transport system ATPase subunit
VLLDNVSGRFLPGRLTAIIGPSGAGKSSLLNVLAGHRTVGVEGEILVNNEPRNVDSFRKKSSYIQQNIELLDNITVLETLTYAADLKLNAKMKKYQKLEIVSR